MYSADNMEPHLTGVVMHFLLASNNAAALLCKRHETLLRYRVNAMKTGVKTQQKFTLLPEVFLCKRSLRCIPTLYPVWGYVLSVAEWQTWLMYSDTEAHHQPIYGWVDGRAGCNGLCHSAWVFMFVQVDSITVQSWIIQILYLDYPHTSPRFLHKCICQLVTSIV